jgi:hypothetical protein
MMCLVRGKDDWLEERRDKEGGSLEEGHGIGAHGRQ